MKWQNNANIRYIHIDRLNTWEIPTAPCTYVLCLCLYLSVVYCLILFVCGFYLFFVSFTIQMQ